MRLTLSGFWFIMVSCSREGIYRMLWALVAGSAHWAEVLVDVSAHWT